MTIKKHLFILSLFVLFQSCGQEKKSQAALNTKIEEIVAYATKGLPDYEKMEKLPDLYNISISSSNCKYEILISDLQSAAFFNDSQGSVTSKTKGINSSLLGSGLTPIEIRLFPSTGKQVLDKYASISIKIEHIPHMGSAEGRETVWTYKMPMLEQPLPTFVHKGAFEVTVPFKLTSLENAVDLSTLDSTQLRKEVDAQFATFISILEQGDGVALLDFTRERERVGTVQWYSTKKELKEEMVTDIERIQKSKLVPLPKSILRFYGKNKIVTLRKAKTLETYIWMDDGEYYFGRALNLYKTKDNKWHVW
ncbi:hypothetical protein AX016_0074 [Cellulophaga sp. RHA19]|uniref:hypothetical protein n=1 Tax=Cellulophaga sp. RHA19 TaxID=1798237 RepID=UPI000C2CB653|nr:hypothetical protein [Cellulophaga sp. RHA19]PKB41920.1 hypothetical protein AX016_0074 [Cellulophaga sp. RHA19]